MACEENPRHKLSPIGKLRCLYPRDHARRRHSFGGRDIGYKILRFPFNENGFSVLFNRSTLFCWFLRVVVPISSSFVWFRLLLNLFNMLLYIALALISMGIVNGNVVVENSPLIRVEQQLGVTFNTTSLDVPGLYLPLSGNQTLCFSPPLFSARLILSNTHLPRFSQVTALSVVEKILNSNR